MIAPRRHQDVAATKGDGGPPHLPGVRPGERLQEHRRHLVVSGRVGRSTRSSGSAYAHECCDRLQPRARGRADHLHCGARRALAHDRRRHGRSACTSIGAASPVARTARGGEVGEDAKVRRRARGSYCSASRREDAAARLPADVVTRSTSSRPSPDRHERNANRGSHRPRHRAVPVTDLSNGVDLADLYERDSRASASAVPSPITTPAYPGIDLRGRVTTSTLRCKPETATASSAPS